MSNVEAQTAARRSRSQGDVVMLVLGVCYLALSVIGFVTVGWQQFGYEEPVRMLGVLGVSTLLNIVHALVGAVLTLAGLRRSAAAIAPVLVVAFTAAVAFGVVARLFGGNGDPLNLTWWNVVLYALSALIGVYVYATALKRRAAARAEDKG
jgi:hypothetical protein